MKAEDDEAKKVVANDASSSSVPAPPQQMPRHEPGTSIPLLVIQGAVDQDLDVVIEVTNGYRYRGRIRSFDQHMNATIANATVTCVHRPAFVASMKEVFLRGSQVVDVVLPSSLLPQYEIRAASYKKFYNAARLAQRRQKKAKPTAEGAKQTATNEAKGDQAKPKKRTRAENPTR